MRSEKKPDSWKTGACSWTGKVSGRAPFHVLIQPDTRRERGVGLFHPVTETTAKMLSGRQTRSLRDPAARTTNATSVEEACRLAAEARAELDLDLPFALPARIHLAETNEPWPMQDALSRGQPLLV